MKDFLLLTQRGRGVGLEPSSISCECASRRAAACGKCHAVSCCSAVTPPQRLLLVNCAVSVAVKHHKNFALLFTRFG